MKKLMKMMAIVGMLFASMQAVAGDVYAVKMTCSVPEIKQATQYYKEFTTKTYNGYAEVNYAIDGTIETPSVVVLYGKFVEGNAVRTGTLDIAVCNIYGKNKDKVEMTGVCDLGDLVLTLAGKGNRTIESTGVDSCGDTADCSGIVRINTVSGQLTGSIDDVVCDPCGGSMWAWILNNCIDNEPQMAVYDVVTGNWSMRYNKALSVSCSTEGFPACVWDKIPTAYK